MIYSLLIVLAFRSILERQLQENLQFYLIAGKSKNKKKQKSQESSLTETAPVYLIVNDWQKTFESLDIKELSSYITSDIEEDKDMRFDISDTTSHSSLSSSGGTEEDKSLPKKEDIKTRLREVIAAIKDSKTKTDQLELDNTSVLESTSTDSISLTTASALEIPDYISIQKLDSDNNDYDIFDIDIDLDQVFQKIENRFKSPSIKQKDIDGKTKKLKGLLETIRNQIADDIIRNAQNEEANSFDGKVGKEHIKAALKTKEIKTRLIDAVAKYWDLQYKPKELAKEEKIIDKLASRIAEYKEKEDKKAGSELYKELERIMGEEAF